MERKLAVITGASSGIGATFARKLAGQYDLLLVARREDRLAQLAAELRASTQADIFAADLADEGDTHRLAERLAADPRMALLVNNAGFGTLGRFWERPLAEQEGMHRLHVMATVRLTHAALGNMTKRDEGAVINVASVAGFVRGQGSVSYCATKSWMNIFSEGLYLELKGAGSKVKVQTLCPGFTYSEFHDTLGLDRSGLAPKAFWLTAERVVDESLAGLKKGKLYVVPGWRYGVLTGVVSKLPTGWRLAVELARGKARTAPVEIPPSTRSV